jgi:hypothetical protein
MHVSSRIFWSIWGCNPLDVVDCWAAEGLTVAVVRISGIPYSRNKVRGNLGGPAAWTVAVYEQTKHLSPVTGPCRVRVKFFLPRANAPKDFPFGNDLDNLLKRFFDALNETVFRNAPGRDSSVIEVIASKVLVDRLDDAGAELEQFQFHSPD